MSNPEEITIVEDKELSKEDMIDILNDEVEEKESPEKEEKEEEKDEEEEKEEDIEEEDEKEGEEKLEVPHYTRKELLKTYPDLFKKFPLLEKSYYRERKFTEIYPTLDEAKEAQEKSSVLDRLEADVGSGNTVPILKAIKDNNQEAFNKTIDNYLPALFTVDKDAYYHVVGGVIKDAVAQIAQEAKESNNEELKETAKNLYKFVFGSTNWEPHKKLSSDKKEDDDSLKKEREAFNRERFETAKNDLVGKVQNTLKATVDANIDPKSLMTDYVKRNAIREVMEALDSQLDSDREFQSQRDRLWKRAHESSFSRDSIDRIKSAYLSKAKTLLPGIIKRTRIDALKGMGKKVSEEKNSRLPVGRTASSPKIKEANEIPKGMKTIDFLMQD